tara:strand:- start:738 stop:1457 length:720 start_codon:yes stop_codon:yes gene_type:complete
MTEILRKMVAQKIKVLGEGQISAVLSTEAVDRDGDIIRVSGWDLTNFNKHPVLADGHRYDSMSQIGKWLDVKVVGKQLRGTAEYFIDKGNPAADWAYQVAEMGQAAYSVGFIPDMEKAEILDDSGWWATYEFKGQELLECSHVVVPSNPEAVQRRKWARTLIQADEGAVIYGTLETGALSGICDDLEQLEILITMLTARIDTYKDSNVDDVVERLKADFPHLFTTPDEVRHLQGVVSQW